MRLTPIFNRSAILAVVIAGTMLLLCGCGDARKVAELQARIETLEKKQLEDGIKLAGMSEKIVTKAIDVQGTIKSESLIVGNIKSGLIEVGGSLPVVTIDPFVGIVISSLNDARKTGSIAKFDSESFKIDDYESNKEKIKHGFKGAGVVFSLSRGAGKSEFKMWDFSDESPKISWWRNLKTESILNSETVIFSIWIDTKFTSQIGANHHEPFGVRLISISDDGLLRFELVNSSALTLLTIRGTIETTTGRGSDKSTSFVIDQNMQTGKWYSVAVDIGVKKKDILFVTLKNLQVDHFIPNQ